MTSPHYQQSIDTCFETAIGTGGISASTFDVRLAGADKALAWLRDAYETGSLPVLRVPERRDDIPALKEVADGLLKDTSDLFLFGIGGSSLGAQALAQLTGWGTPAHAVLEERPRIHLVDNLDAVTMDALLANCDLRTTRFLVVSKSGGTVEPAMQMLVAMSAIEKAGGGKYMKHHFAVLTEPAKDGKPNALRALAEAHGFPALEHDPGVGGRFAVLTNVGLAPAHLFGLDVEAIREGAFSVMKPILDGAAAGDVAPAQGAALSLAFSEEKHANMSVFLAYADRLERFLAWHVQLWAESLGKEGKGTTPIRALGPVDQHSQLQLWLGGPKDKLFNVFTTDTKGTGPAIAPEIAKGTGFEALSGHTVGDLVDAEQRATFDTLANNGLPVRGFHVPVLNEKAIGALLMHFMLETMIAGHMMGINTFDQPAVEEGKILARNYLAEGKG
ncbi:glucose-6-phosphate isomerase [Parvibaculum indicum]|uniref:glucose-6-phosphate isomerase n=1 Tax=Parvibaculum indicum TaxID=562969 RepID=UPI001421A7EB|nr:glucose-6-phosphate isomerase [Parvibaculum indicum]NIJ40828.1 glucose-6-phosphate isomerase [Parvibaculum indicum]